MSLKAHKELETKVNEQLYNNILLLTKIYPPVEEFKNVFRENMFIKNNKAAFHQVVYYLLSILDPEKIKQKVPTWPLYEVRLENQFRNEVMKYINELNSTYEYANIPQIMTSHLISPGGFKFVKFMLKLSQLVLFEHLQKHNAMENKIFYPTKPSKNNTVTTLRCNQLHQVTKHINNDIQHITNNFKQKFAQLQIQADNIMKEQETLNKELNEIKISFEHLKSDFKNKFPNCELETALDLRLQELQENVRILKTQRDEFKKLQDLVTYISNKGVCLEYNKENFEVPDGISHIIEKDDTLDLIHLVKSFNIFMNCSRLEICEVNKDTISQNLDQVNAIIDKLKNLNENYDKIHSKFNKLSIKLQETVDVPVTNQNKFKHLLVNNEDTMLAVPLELTPNNLTD